jgi:WhiB family transcriptional regulator, redox-sensing transcriptional regulator
LFNGVVAPPQWPPEFQRLLDFFADCPPLPGALCRGHADIFDAPAAWPPTDADRARIAQAKALCRRCPVLADCKAWDASLPRRQHATGVIAGHLRRNADAGWKPT